MSHIRQLVALAVFLAAAGVASAQERIAIGRISLDRLAADTQATPGGSDDSHLALVWWIPYEYWAAAFSREGGMPAAQREATIKVLRDYSLLAVVQADIQVLGAFRYYDLETVAGSLAITLESGDHRARLEPLKDVSTEMQPLLGALKPMLASAMGNLGSNMHFFVLADRDTEDRRIIDPYEANVLRIALAKSNGEHVDVAIEMPVDSLFVPRICPNGKSAHVSWRYCPWGGERL
ncbi:MAG TPA: hypothetical protein VFR29_00620 [Steroidobacteraceae bacterium]|nr:hypothetical protein [Steroidobacteraceae bacterium]